MRWLPRTRRRPPRREGAWPSCAGASCSPTTTPTCATTWSGCSRAGSRSTRSRTGTEALAAVRARPARSRADRRDDARARRLRAGGRDCGRCRRLADTPVLMLSARAGEEAQSEGLEAGADDYLVKPFSPRELLARIDAHLARRTLRRLERQHARQLASVFENAPVAIAMLRGPELVYDFANPSYRALVAGRDVVGKPLLGGAAGAAGAGRSSSSSRACSRGGEPFADQALRVQLERRPGRRRWRSASSTWSTSRCGTTRGESTPSRWWPPTSRSWCARGRSAEEANRAKDEFLAMLGHELRNPLAPMLTALQLMRLRAPDDRWSGSAAIIERQVQHLARLVDDLLDVSRIARGKIELQARAGGAGRGGGRGGGAGEPAARGARAPPRRSSAAHGLRVVADPARLAQVFANLLHQRGQVHRPRRASHRRRSRREGPEALLSVRDDGVGDRARAAVPRCSRRSSRRARSSTGRRAASGSGSRW